MYASILNAPQPAAGLRPAGEAGPRRARLGGARAFSLVLGAMVALLRSWPDRLIGLVLAFGAGALVSSVSFELFEEA